MAVTKQELLGVQTNLAVLRFVCRGSESCKRESTLTSSYDMLTKLNVPPHPNSVMKLAVSKHAECCPWCLFGGIAGCRST